VFWCVPQAVSWERGTGLVSPPKPHRWGRSGPSCRENGRIGNLVEFTGPAIVGGKDKAMSNEDRKRADGPATRAAVPEFDVRTGDLGTVQGRPWIGDDLRISMERWNAGVGELLWIREKLAAAAAELAQAGTLDVDAIVAASSIEAAYTRKAAALEVLLRQQLNDLLGLVVSANRHEEMRLNAERTEIKERLASKLVELGFSKGDAGRAIADGCNHPDLVAASNAILACVRDRESIWGEARKVNARRLALLQQPAA